MRINPLTAIDFYKADHRRQYPDGTTKIYSNFTARSSKLANKIDGISEDKIIFFGLQYFIQYFLIETWNKEFFQKPKELVVNKYKRRMDYSLGKDAISVEHIEELHDLGYLPIEIKAVPEGSYVNIKVPVLTIENTRPEFFWLTNYLESVMSCMLWKPTTCATIAYQYRKLLTKYAIDTGGNMGFIDFQAHDFSFRGMSGLQDAAMCGAAHLTVFKGTDTVPAIDLLEDYYGGYVIECEGKINDIVGCSVPATEHSVMCMGTKEDEIGTFKRLITELYPRGIVSIVSDTWNLWAVLNNYAPSLKKEIELRDGKVVFRPDSGNPVDIICGDKSSNHQLEREGALEILWRHFGGTVNEKGYKVLNPKVGLIYGDSITLERANAILERMKELGFASTNIVFGVGSFTYQYITRDTYGFAMKATYGEINGEPRNIYKDPITDNGIKKSAKGLLKVIKQDNDFILLDEQETSDGGELQTVFKDGRLKKIETLCKIRERINNYLEGENDNSEQQ